MGNNFYKVVLNNGLMVERKFCGWQDKLEDDGEGEFSCLADLESGRIFSCKYNVSEIRVVGIPNSERKKLAFVPSEEQKYVCNDFKAEPWVYGEKGLSEDGKLIS